MRHIGGNYESTGEWLRAWWQALLAIGSLLYVVLSAMETFASIGCIVIVFGEVIHLWDLL